MDDVKRKVAKWHNMNISFLKEINSLVQEIKVSESLQIICYFTYSFNISHMRGNDNFCLGSFHLYNNGGKPLQNPYICIKLSSNCSFEFSGKYGYKDSKQDRKSTRLNSSHVAISYAVFCLKKKKNN